MGPLDWILVAIRWAHALAAVAWVGGSMFYVLVLGPAWRRTNPGAEAGRAVGGEFRAVVTSAMAVLLVTGAVLTVSRLTGSGVSAAYVAVLVLKVALALYMFYTVWLLRPSAGGARRTPTDSGPDVVESRWRRARRSLTSTNAVLIAGIVVFGLADVLDALFERGLTR